MASLEDDLSQTLRQTYFEFSPDLRTDPSSANHSKIIQFQYFFQIEIFDDFWVKELFPHHFQGWPRPFPHKLVNLAKDGICFLFLYNFFRTDGVFNMAPQLAAHCPEQRVVRCTILLVAIDLLKLLQGPVVPASAVLLTIPGDADPLC